MPSHTEPAPAEDIALYRAIAEAMFAAVPDKTMWHDLFQATLLIVDTVEQNADKSGPFRHFMASRLRERAVMCTHAGLAQQQPGDVGPSASGARCTELTDKFLDLTEGMQVSEDIGAALNLIDIAVQFITPADRMRVAARMIHNAQAIAAAEASDGEESPAANVAPGATPLH